MKYAITIIIGLLVALGLMFLAPKMAKAQGVPQNCAKHADFIKFLNDKYNETGTALGIAGYASLVELYMSEGGATWTIIISQPNGMACIIAAGKDWMTKAPIIDGKDS